MYDLVDGGALNPNSLIHRPSFLSSTIFSQISQLILNFKIPLVGEWPNLLWERKARSVDLFWPPPHFSFSTFNSDARNGKICVKISQIVMLLFETD